MVSNFIFVVYSGSCGEFDDLGGLTRFWQKLCFAQIVWQSGCRDVASYVSTRSRFAAAALVADASWLCSSEPQWPFATAGPVGVPGLSL